MRMERGDDVFGRRLDRCRTLWQVFQGYGFGCGSGQCRRRSDRSHALGDTECEIQGRSIFTVLLSRYFFEENEDKAVAELNRNWMTARRALLRKPFDRMGFGGYLSLAAKFPKFVKRAGEICEEFRTITETAGSAKPYCGLTVAILNAWGSLRSWQSHMVAHELWYQQIYSYQGILESLSGLPVNVRFISFDDFLKGIDRDIDVIINAGDAGTSYSGGEYWNNEKLVEAVRAWVREGHGFIGVGEPTAYQKTEDFSACRRNGCGQRAWIYA